MCSYHKILKIDSDKRTRKMMAMIESQELGYEAGRLLLSTRAHTLDLDIKRLSNLKGKLDTSDEAVVIEKVSCCLLFSYAQMAAFCICAAELAGITCLLMSSGYRTFTDLSL